MIGMRRHKLLLGFYLSGLVLNIVCCFTMIPAMPLEGAALSLTITKVWVAILTVSFFQWAAKPMTLGQWALMLGAAAASVALWWSVGLALRESWPNWPVLCRCWPCSGSGGRRRPLKRTRPRR